MKKKHTISRTTAFDRVARSPEAVSQMGHAMGHAFVQAMQMMNGGVAKEASLGNPSAVNIYGRNSIFDPCQAGDIWGLQVQTHALLAWLGWRTNKWYNRRIGFIDWMGPEGTADGTATTGAVAPCDDAASWEFGKCGYNLFHNSWYARAGKTLGPHESVMERCETTPLYRLNGQLITDDVEWQMNGIMTVLDQSIRRDLVHGNHANEYEMNGLEAIIKTGYVDPDTLITCPRVDAHIVDWQHDNLDGAHNGLGNFFDYMDELVTEIEYRGSFMLGGISETDMILLTSRFMATCLLDAYACYTTCGVTSAYDITEQALRAEQRAARRDLNGGPLYDGKVAVGYISLKSGRRLPIFVDDTLDVTYDGAEYCTDIYILTRRVGNIDVLYGEYLDLRVYENRIRKHDPRFRVRTDAAGRFAIKGKEDNFCHQIIVGTSPELYLAAPWAQARIEDVCCSRKRQPIVGDPFQPVYLPGGAPVYPAVVDTY